VGDRCKVLVWEAVQSMIRFLMSVQELKTRTCQEAKQLERVGLLWELGYLESLED